MWTFLNSYAKIRIIALLLLLLLLYVSPVHGSSATTSETPQLMTVRMELWNELNRELNQQANSLQEASAELKKLRKPSAQLLNELTEAQQLLRKSQEELRLAKENLTSASKEVDALKTSCKTLKQKIEKERRVQRRQIWQNRFWFLLIGLTVGSAGIK